MADYDQARDPWLLSERDDSYKIRWALSMREMLVTRYLNGPYAPEVSDMLLDLFFAEYPVYVDVIRNDPTLKHQLKMDIIKHAKDSVFFR